VLVLRQLGPTLVFFTYSPGSLNDPAAAADVAEALATVGQVVPIQG
jgi:predicted ATP-grasp superfamily ATP-dependent carboligase